jgi:periplasmic protein CpxP/Spy
LIVRKSPADGSRLPATDGRSAYRFARIFAALLLLAPVSALAQGAPPPPPPPPNPAPASPQSGTATPSQGESVDQRIRALQQQLGITAAQMPQWNAFAQAMRDNATSTDELFRQRADSVKTMTALDNMKSYARVVRAYADDTDRLEAAFETLYNALSNQQKQTLDTLFRRQATQSAGALPALR